MPISKLMTSTTFPPVLDSLAAKLFPSSDPLDAPGIFDPNSLINKQFPSDLTSSSLASYIASLRSQLASTDDSIARAVRGHTRAAAESRTELAAAKSAISDLGDRIASIRNRAEDTEKAVRTVSKDVMQLDLAKKNITATITTLKRLVMLVNACEQLTFLAGEREYTKTAALVSALKEQQGHFEPLKGVPRVDELLKHSSRIFNDLQSQLLEDLSARLVCGGDIRELYAKRKLASDNGESQAHGSTTPDFIFTFDVTGACDTAEALGEAVKREVVASYIQRVFTDYRERFSSSGIDAAELRFQWLSRALRDHSERFGGSFPEHWFVASQICLFFCTLTRAHFADSVRSINKIDPSLMITIMTKSIELETDMQRRFEKQYKEVVARYIGKISPIPEDRKASFECPVFKGCMSEVFAPFVAIWIKQEERALFDYLGVLRQSVGDEVIGSEPASLTGTVNGPLEKNATISESLDEDDDPRLIFSSAVELFTRLKSLLAKARTSGVSAEELATLFKRAIAYYVDIVLRGRLPEIKSMGEENLEISCAVKGSCEYVLNTAPLLQSRLNLEIGIFSAESERAKELSTEALTSVAGCFLASETEAAFHHMTTLDWYSVETVAGTSAVVGRIGSYLARCMRETLPNLKFPDFKTVCELVASLVHLLKNPS